MQKRTPQTEQYITIGFFILLSIFGFAAFISTQKYIGMFFIAFVVTIVLHPVYKWLLKKVHYKIIASFITMVFFIIILIIPLSVIGLVAINQGISLFTDLTQNISIVKTSTEITNFITTDLFPAINTTSEFDIEQLIQNTTLNILGLLSGAAFYLISNGMILLIEFGIFLLFLTFFFPEKDTLLNQLTKIAPLTAEESSRFVNRFAAITKKLSVSIIIVPLVQGTLMWFIFMLLDVPGAIFWGVVTGVVSLFPVIGVSLIWIPATIIFAIQGDWINASIIGLYGLIIMNFSDNLVRAWLLKGKETQVPELVTLLSAIGGIFAFGFFGLFYGPVIVVTFLALLDIYKTRIEAK
ncbi:MAG: AI-2E family transporter [Candidatus Moraniibacteriota bacterium]|jgi:predicted PurR-regulated permease PerM